MSRLISVIMTTYNEKVRWVQEAVDSLLNQSYQSIEIIIVNDNPDNTELLSLLKQYENNYTNIKVLENKINMGLPKSLNLAFNHANGMYIARMDADDICHPDRFQIQVGILENHSDIDLISTSCEYMDEDSNRTGSNKITNDVDPKLVARIMKHGNILVHPSWMMRRNVYEKLDGYRDIESTEDYDFALRAISSGLNILKIANKLLVYRIRGNSISQSKGFQQYLTSNYIRRLHKQRLRKGRDSFNLQDLKEAITYTENEKGRFNRAKIAVDHLTTMTNLFVVLTSKYGVTLLLNKSVVYTLQRIKFGKDWE